MMFYKMYRVSLCSVITTSDSFDNSLVNINKSTKTES
jgi:hypothetical protein